MRRKIVTPNGEADIVSIFEYLNERTPNAAAAYLRIVTTTFENFPDDIWMPPQASPSLPDNIRVMHLSSPFRHYTFRVAIFDDAVYLLSAFAPGLSDHFKDSRTQRGLDDL